jgi:hypothetical protein
MKRFSFPLEIVRRWRAEQASVEELKLQQIRAAKDRLGALKTAIRAELAKTEEGLLAQAILVPHELETLDSYRIYVQGRVRGLENEERQAETNIVAQRHRVMEARRQFELLDRLRIKTYTEWTAATNRKIWWRNCTLQKRRPRRGGELLTNLASRPDRRIQEIPTEDGLLVTIALWLFELLIGLVAGIVAVAWVISLTGVAMFLSGIIPLRPIGLLALTLLRIIPLTLLT